MAIETTKCPICGLDNTTKEPLENTYRINCPACGKFNIGTAFDIPEFDEYEKIKLRYYYYTLDSNDNKRLTNYITRENKKVFIDNINAPKTITEKFDYIIRYFYEKTKYMGQEIQIERPYGYRLFFCIDDNELNSILEELKKYKYITGNQISTLDVMDTKNNTPRRIKMTIEGLKYAESLSNNINSVRCFVAMWFNQEKNIDKGYYNMQKVYSESIEPAIENEGRKQKLKSVKIDNIQHNDDVVDKIIAEIRRSKFVVADLTGNRGGVYYEAGFAEGLGIPVIYTCNKEWLNGNKDKQIPPVHFDTSHKNITIWEYDKLEKFKNDLTDRINATIP